MDSAADAMTPPGPIAASPDPEPAPDVGNDASPGVDAGGGGRPRRRGSRIEHELYPRSASWLELMPAHASASTRFVFACLEYGALEAWQDTQGCIRLYLPEAVGGYLIVGAPGDAAEAIDLHASDPAHGDPDALMRRPGAAWLTLLPGIHRGRRRPRPAPSASRRTDS